MTTPAAAMTQRFCTGIDVYPMAVRHPIAFVLLAAAAGASCRSGTRVAANPPIVQPGAPGQPSRVIGAAQASDLSQVQYTGADIKFMQGMIGHHAQAIEMTSLIATHTASDDMKKLGARISISQDDEIHMMQTWLKVRGQQVPDRNAMHMHGATLMPGMLTPDEMKQLADAKGSAFDKLFLEGMIKHHGGALTMVQDLFGTPGAGQDSEIFAFASDVDADQRMEIERMTALLDRMKEHQQ